MSSYLGLDPQAVRSLATQMTHASDEIRQLSQRLTNQLQNVQWTGADREQFVNEWQSSHMSALNNVCSALEQASQQANANAQQQEQASNS